MCVHDRDAYNMVMPYTHITQVLLAEVKTDGGFENIPSFVFVTFFSYNVPYASLFSGKEMC